MLRGKGKDSWYRYCVWIWCWSEVNQVWRWLSCKPRHCCWSSLCLIHNRLFQRRVFSGSQLDWYWQGLVNRHSDVWYCVPRTQTRLGDRSFAVAGPRLWNNLPVELRQRDICLSEFRRLRHFCFAEARRLVTFCLSVPCASTLTYLLTYAAGW